MKRIVIAGRDRTADLLPGLGGQRAPGGEPPPALALGQAKNQSDYLERLIALLRTHGALRTDSGEVPVPPGLLGRLLKPLRRLQWRVFRYQHDRMAFQQNAINRHVAAVLECLREECRGDIARLEARIAALEGELAALRDAPERRP